MCSTRYSENETKVTSSLGAKSRSAIAAKWRSLSDNIRKHVAQTTNDWPPPSIMFPDRYAAPTAFSAASVMRTHLGILNVGTCSTIATNKSRYPHHAKSLLSSGSIGQISSGKKGINCGIDRNSAKPIINNSIKSTSLEINFNQPITVKPKLSSLKKDRPKSCQSYDNDDNNTHDSVIGQFEELETNLSTVGIKAKTHNIARKLQRRYSTEHFTNIILKSPVIAQRKISQTLSTDNANDDIDIMYQIKSTNNSEGTKISKSLIGKNKILSSQQQPELSYQAEYVFDDKTDNTNANCCDNNLDEIDPNYIGNVIERHLASLISKK